MNPLPVDRDGVRVRHHASFRTQRRELVAVVGPKGTGKRTLLETVVGLRAARGRAALDDQTLDSFRRRATAFAYMPDEAAFPEEASVTTNPLR